VSKITPFPLEPGAVTAVERSVVRDPNLGGSGKSRKRRTVTTISPEI